MTIRQAAGGHPLAAAILCAGMMAAWVMPGAARRRPGFPASPATPAAGRGS